MRRKVNNLTWNKTLEHFAHIYARPTHIYDEHIIDLMYFCQRENIIQIPYNVDQYEEIYEQLSNVTEYFDKPSDLGLPAYFFHLIITLFVRSYVPRMFPKSATNKVTQMGCDYAHANWRILKTLRILCFYNYPLDEWDALPSRNIAKCLYNDNSLSFSKCSVDSPCSKHPGLIRISIHTLHLFCLILLTVNF
ncbi:hypothetical protein EG68_02274 [Paragonimus skrjabini miyazakii]|uniref:Uncharacterized protein n=1 Tax=Paragonimus skrjabini miyazakii TaxID=59628 RepID=A0A8S9Z4R7_9TREM|nr:hypothetical protein EG68_02274 [Paragonimus skrjabini miyazakii]